MYTHIAEQKSSEETLIERVAKEIVTVESYGEAVRSYDKRTRGENILLIGPDWEDDIKFKRNHSDTDSFEQKDLIRD